MNNRNLVLVRTYSTAHEAGFLRDLLEDNDIPAQVFDEHANRLYPHMSILFGARVMVRAADLERAQALAAEHEQNLNSASPRDPVPEKTRALTFAYRSAVYGAFIVPGLSSLVAAYHLYRYSAIERLPGEAISKRKLAITWIFIFVGLAFAAAFIAHF